METLFSLYARMAMMFAWHLTVTVAADSSIHNNTIRVGYFMTTDPYRAAAVNLAIDQAQREGILNQTHFRYRYSRKLHHRFTCLLLYSYDLVSVEQKKNIV